jgi:hypothetical protein
MVKNNLIYRLKNILLKITSEVKRFLTHDCFENKKVVGLRTSTILGRKKIIKIRYKCQKCFKSWEG